MTLLELHAELAETNLQLKRIADCLERAIPLSPLERLQEHKDQHPLIGRSDVSVMTPDHAAQVAQKRDTMPVTASHDQTGQPSQSGQWDHDDPLDTYPELDHEWSNYTGIDR